MANKFRWIDWNIGHIAKHGVTFEEAEFLVRNAKKPFPAKSYDERYIVVGQTGSGEYLQVAYIFDPPGVVFVIHARPLTDSEKKRFRRRRRL